MDLFIAGWVWNDKAHFWAYCLMAAAGSAIGGLVPYGIGRAGRRAFPAEARKPSTFRTVAARFERQEFLAVMIPSMLPPPTPWKIFVFAAGVFEMRVLPYMLAVFCGRMVRWLLLALLVLKLGPGAVDLVAHHALTAFVVVLVLAVAGFPWWWLRRRRSGAARCSVISSQPNRNLTDRLLRGEGRLRGSIPSYGAPAPERRRRGRNDRGGEQIIAIERNGRDVAGLQSRKGARIHTAPSPDGVVRDHKERGGSEDDACGDADET